MGRGPRIYDLQRWREQIAPTVLAEEPACRLCAAIGVQTPAVVVDHIQPVRLRPDLAEERSNLQPLCKHHHDSAKQQQERRGYHAAVDARGYPVDPAHPANRGEVTSKSARYHDRRGAFGQSEPAREPARGA